MVGLRDAGQGALAKMLQFLGDRDRSSLDFEDNRGLGLPIYVGARSMWRKAEVPTSLAARPRGPKSGPRQLTWAKAAKTGGALLVLGLACSLVDRAIAQQQPNLPNQLGQSQVQIVPQSPGYRTPKTYQVTPQTNLPTPMYPQSPPRQQNSR
jgi:hypothetical protein